MVIDFFNVVRCCMVRHRGEVWMVWKIKFSTNGMMWAEEMQRIKLKCKQTNMKKYMCATNLHERIHESIRPMITSSKRKETSTDTIVNPKTLGYRCHYSIPKYAIYENPILWLRTRLTASPKMPDAGIRQLHMRSNASVWCLLVVS